MFEDFDWEDARAAEEVADPAETSARAALGDFFERNARQVYFSRQLEVQNEGQYFHWITNRAIRDLGAEGAILSEKRSLNCGGTIKLVWNKSFRYYKRAAARLVDLVNEYSAPNIGAALGLQGEALVLDGFASIECLMKGRNTNKYGGQVWTQSDHELDFIFERDGRAYGVEVKNMLGYMDRTEFETKIRMCAKLGIRPVFAARMLPKSWINDLITEGGFALIMKYQLYPWAHRDLGRRVGTELGLPVDAPRRLAEGTMARFLRWHTRL